MIGKVVLIAVLCVSYVLADVPINRYRYRPQQLRQFPSRHFFARQEAPYPAANDQPAASYGPPTTAAQPVPSYGPPAASYGTPVFQPADPEPTNNEAIGDPDSEVVAGAEPSRLTSQKLTSPSKNGAQKLSQRLELQQQVHLPNPQQIHQVQLTPLVAPIQREGSYFIQLPSGVIQRVNYVAQPSLVDNSLAARLQFRPVATVQTSYNEPQVLVNTLVNSYTSADE